MKLPTAEQMQNLDTTAINDYGIPGVVLMENAGRGTVCAMTDAFGSPQGKKILIFVGPGNNGGDGLVIARHLYQLGALPQVFLLVRPEKMKGDAAINLHIVQKLPVPISLVLDADGVKEAESISDGAWAAVDAIFGTGLKREVSGHFALTCELINRLPCPVVAVDIPSGVDSDSGRILGACVRADLTATYGLAKPGHFIHPGAELTGRLEVIDITIPHEAVLKAGIPQELLSPETLQGWVPERSADAHKGTYGHLLILAGSTGKTGAAILSAEGALRSGAGLVTLCVPKDLNPIFETSLPEAMTVPLPHSTTGHISANDASLIQESALGKKAVAIGPGIGTDPDTAQLVLSLYTELTIPAVIDADGLTLLAATLSELTPAAPRILTPHPGEMARLTGKTTKDIQTDRLRTAASFAQENKVILVLKGSRTVIAAPDGRVAINPTGNPGMAAGGMGDVLTGLIAGFLAQGLSPWQAACLGVYLHGLAGDRIVKKTGMKAGFLASELAAEVPLAMEEIRGSEIKYSLFQGN